MESEENTGSTFHFTVIAEAAVEQTLENVKTPTDLQGKKVLIVDDNSDSRAITEKLLASFGFSSVSVGSGEAALAKLSMPDPHGAFDLFIIDSIMPGLSGIQTVQTLRDLNLKTPIIMMTAFGQDKTRPLEQSKDINAVVYKPIKASSLYDGIMDVFGKLSLKTKNQSKAKTFSYQDRIKGIRVLLVEDNLTNQEIAHAVLDKAKVNLAVCNNGREAVLAVEKQNFDAILMDIQMPEMDGYEATKIIRKTKNLVELPIIAMTAHAMKGDEEKCLSAGMNGYITKPINQAILFQTLWEFTRSKSSGSKSSGSKPNGSKSDGVKPIGPKALSAPKNSKIIFLEKESDPDLPSMLPGLNIDEALEIVCLSKPVFKKILINFFQHHQDTSRQFKKILQEENWEGLLFLAHRIKGVCGYIGAHPLQETTQKLESACRKKDPKELDIPLIKNLVASVIAEFDQIMNSLSLIANTRTDKP